MRERDLWLLVLILLFGTAARLINIDLLSLWIDEGFTWNLTQYADPALILRQDVHPPLYFALVDVWVELTGTSVLAMRYLSLLPSVLSIAVVYRVAQELARQTGWNAAGVGLVAALLLALTDAEIFLAQEVRSYTLHVLFAALSMWGFLRWLRIGGRGALLLWLLSTIALIYTFYLGAFVGVVQGLYALLFLRGRQRVLAIGGLVLCALALLPWLLYTFPEQSGNISRAEIITLADFPFWSVDFRDRYFTGQWALWAGLALLGLVRVDGDTRLRVDWRVLRLMSLVGMWLVVPLMLTILINEVVPLYQPRRVSQIVPAIALLAAFGLSNIRPPARQLLLLAIVVYGVTAVDFWRPKQDWRDMAQDTAPFIAPATPLLLELGGDDYAPRYHYGEALPNSHDFLLQRDTEPAPDANPIVGLTTWRNLEPESYAAGLPATIDAYNALWLFYWSSDRGALDWLEQFGHQRTATFTVDFNPDVFLYRYDRLPQEPLLRFENGMSLYKALIHEGPYVELVWTSDAPLERDYTTSAFLLDGDGRNVAQFDSQPFLNQRPTSQWDAGEAIYDPKRLQLSVDDLAAGDYQVGVAVYTVDDNGLSNSLTEAGEPFAVIGSLSTR